MSKLKKRGSVFNPDLNPGEIISNRELMSIFHCACEGGIRYSSKTATIVLVVNNTKSGLPNIWQNGILQFAGRIVKDNGNLGGQNRRLEAVLHDNGDVFLFEVNNPGKYEFKGKVELAAKPHFAQTENGEKYPVFPLRIN